MARILIIDDDPSFGDLTKQRLTKAGYEVIYQNSGFGTSLALQKGNFDLLVLDVNLPGFSGRAILRLIKEKKIHNVKVLLHSSMDYESLRAVAKEEGADSFLTKAVSREEFLSKIKAMLFS
jgi:DNA-binding response OmpR family regulator